MKPAFLLFFYSLFFFGCETEKTECPESVCTLEFASVGVKFLDTYANPIVVKDFSAIIRRTGKPTVSYLQDTIHFKGTYAIATDGDTQQLSAEGDIIDVSAVNPKTNKKKTLTFVISGGTCACHIKKISGPEEVVLD